MAETKRLVEDTTVSKELKDALARFLIGRGWDVDTSKGIYVELYTEAGCGCCEDASSTLDISFYSKDYDYRRTYEVDADDVESFLEELITP